MGLLTFIVERVMTEAVGRRVKADPVIQELNERIAKLEAEIKQLENELAPKGH